MDERLNYPSKWPARDRTSVATKQAMYEGLKTTADDPKREVSKTAVAERGTSARGSRETDRQKMACKCRQMQRLMSSRELRQSMNGRAPEDGVVMMIKSLRLGIVRRITDGE